MQACAEGNIKGGLKCGIWMWTGFVCLRVETRGGHCEHGNELSYAVTGCKFIDKLKD